MLNFMAIVYVKTKVRLWYFIHPIGQRISSDKASNLPKRDVRFNLLK